MPQIWRKIWVSWLNIWLQFLFTWQAQRLKSEGHFEFHDQIFGFNLHSRGRLNTSILRGIFSSMIKYFASIFIHVAGSTPQIRGGIFGFNLVWPGEGGLRDCLLVKRVKSVAEPSLWDKSLLQKNNKLLWKFAVPYDIWVKWDIFALVTPEWCPDEDDVSWHSLQTQIFQPLCWQKKRGGRCERKGENDGDTTEKWSLGGQWEGKQSDEEEMVEGGKVERWWRRGAHWALSTAQVELHYCCCWSGASEHLPRESAAGQRGARRMGLWDFCPCLRRKMFLFFHLQVFMRGIIWPLMTLMFCWTCFFLPQ